MKCYWLILLIAATLALFACGINTQPAENADPIVQDIRYKLDEKRQLCFAIITSVTYYGYQVVAFTHVPRVACGVER